MYEALKARIDVYAQNQGLELTRELGSGQDGLVWRTQHTAVKCFLDEIRFSRELACYQQLKLEGCGNWTAFECRD